MRKICVVGTIFGVLTTAAPTLPSAAEPAPANSNLEIGYELAFWNIPIGHTDYESTFAANSYTARAHYETGGVIGLFWKSIIDATVNGGIGAHSISPALFDSHSQNHNRPLQNVEMTFQNDDPVTIADPPYDLKKYPVSDEQRKSAVDPMSALTSIFTGTNSDDSHPCGNDVHIFDGRRRYDMQFTYIKDEAVELGNGKFNGMTHLCEIHYEAIAGYPQRDTAAWQNSPKMFADVAEISAPGTPSGRYVIPVKLWSVRSLGTMTITLDKITVDGAAPFGLNNRTG